MADQKKINEIMRKIDSGREYRRMMEVRVKESESEDEESYGVEGYACTFNEPYELLNWGDYIVREQIDPHAFDECDMSDVIMQYDHAGRVFARNSNGTLQLEVDDHGLKMAADLGGTEIGRQLHEEIKGGYTNKMSFGFTISEDKREVTNDHDANVTIVLRTITKIRKLYDVSAVSLPANDGTEISARSYADGVIAELEAERLKSIAIQEARAKALAAINKYTKEVK